MEDWLCSNDNAATNADLCESCVCTTYLTGNVGGQIVVDKAQEYSLLSRYCSWLEYQDFHGNFHVSCGTFLHLVSKLQPVLREQSILHSPIPIDQWIAISLWQLGNQCWIQNHKPPIWCWPFYCLLYRPSSMQCNCDNSSTTLHTNATRW